MFLIVIYSMAVVYFNDSFPRFHFGETKDALSLTSIAIGLIFAFRTNSAYDRWWEGRKLWGQLVNDTRNLSMKLILYFDLNEAERLSFVRLLSAFSLSLKHHLRDTPYRTEWAGLAAAPESCHHVPLYLSGLIQANVLKAKRKNIAGGMEMVLVDVHMRALMDISGACERIKNTSIAPFFTISIWIWLSAYLLLLPWLLAPHIDMWTVPVAMFVAYFGVSLELLAEEMQEPFGRDPNDLPLDRICQSIVKSIEQVFDLSTGVSSEEICVS